MGEYDVLFDPEVATYLSERQEYGRRTVAGKAERLAEDPYPEEGGSLKEPLPFGSDDWYLLRVSRAWVIFYLVDEAEQEVRVVDVQKPREAMPKYEI